MEAVCLTCQVRYHFEDELLQQGSPVVCPTCQVSLIPVHPGTNTPLDGGAVYQPQQDHSPPVTSTETTGPTSMETPTSPSTGQAQGPGNQWDFGNTQWEQSAKPPPAKAAPSAPPLEDWSAAAARWAANGFSADSMPEFIRQPARPSFFPIPPATQTKSFLPTGPSPSVAVPEATFPEPASRSQSEAFIAAPPPLPVPAEVPTIPAPTPAHPNQDSLPPWSRGGYEAEARDQPEDARLALSMALPVTPLAVAVETDAALEHQVEDMADEPVRSSHVVLWALLVLLLAGAGGAAVWYFFLQEETTVIDAADMETGGIADTPVSKKSVALNRVKKPTQADPTAEKGKTPESAQARIQKDDNSADRLSKKDSPAENASFPDAGLEAYKKGNTFIREGKFKEAIGEFKKALASNPKLAQAHRGLGISFAQLRQNRQACQEYRLYRNMLPADSKEIPALESILKDCR